MDKESAIFGAPDEDKTEFEADHSGICRFDTREEKDKGNYLLVKTHIEDTLRASLYPAEAHRSGLGTAEGRSPLPQLLLQDQSSAGESSGWIEGISGHSSSREWPEKTFGGLSRK